MPALFCDASDIPGASPPTEVAERIAREQDRAVQELLTLYVLELFLARLVESSYAGSFVLKGGVLLAGYGLRRPTRDVDMRALDFVLNEEHCRQVVAQRLENARPAGRMGLRATASDAQGSAFE